MGGAAPLPHQSELEEPPAGGSGTSQEAVCLCEGILLCNLLTDTMISWHNQSRTRIVTPKGWVTLYRGSTSDVYRVGTECAST